MWQPLSLQPAADAQAALRVGFGCAGLMRSAGRRRRQRLLGEAFEHGIRHFDVARMYGLGAAERELGQFARTHREQISIATKFGIEAAAPAARLAPLQAPARAAVNRLPRLRARLKSRDQAFRQPGRYDPASARDSLEKSLRALGTDYVDVFFIHDPGPEDRIEMGELKGALEDLRQAGYVRAWGIAGEAERCEALGGSLDAPALLQIRDDIFASGLWPVSQPAITFGVLSAAAGRIVAHVRGSDRRRARWQRAVGEDCCDQSVVASLLLRDALDRNRDGMVLFSTTRPERIGTAVEAAATPPPDEGHALRAFRQCVLVDLIGDGKLDG